MAVIGSTLTGTGTGAAGAAPTPSVVAIGLPRSSGVATPVAQETGVGDINDTVRRFGVVGTDLGVTWDDGRGGILAAFGDTANFDGRALLRGNLYGFRSNVLLRSTDRDLSNGMYFDSGVLSRPGLAKQVLVPEYRREITVLPTGGIAANGRQYMTYMAVKRWGGPGEWVTDRAGVAYSDDDGRNWVRPPEAIRPNVGGNSNFQMSALLKVGDTIYVYGTPSGRFGAVRLARVPASKMTDLGSYEYFSAGKWVRGDVDAATPIIGAPTGEMSVAYNAYLGKYVSLATSNTIVARTASSPEGPWSRPVALLKNTEINSAYAPFIHPWSNGRDLFFTASLFQIYNVLLWKFPLDALR
ncbi:DUF4185 domain-containing protein [Williamsia deligens]|uniref:DUF4185 domain-containing protein n=1 Tax=Williamsia deligens TaxID=321325 RepID=A0ABW3G8A2_9NOCA|nr:DUF4185 domain-containing protein [Williamsia deligens]MCP2194134.1 protein of unknown function (DUF4185) [Williamsia deligens]